MVGIFSRFSSGRGSYGRTTSSMLRSVSAEHFLLDFTVSFSILAYGLRLSNAINCATYWHGTGNLLHRFQSYLFLLFQDEGQIVLSNSESDVALVIPHGVETICDFKPIEHPNEPPDNDHPVTCPAPEPSISNDGKMWKERIAANSRRQSDVSILKDDETQGAPDVAVIKYASPASMPVILPVRVPEKQKCETSEEV